MPASDPGAAADTLEVDILEVVVLVAGIPAVAYRVVDILGDVPVVARPPVDDSRFQEAFQCPACSRFQGVFLYRACFRFPEVSQHPACSRFQEAFQYLVCFRFPEVSLYLVCFRFQEACFPCPVKVGLRDGFQGNRQLLLRPDASKVWLMVDRGSGNRLADLETVVPLKVVPLKAVPLKAVLLKAVLLKAVRLKVVLLKVVLLKVGSLKVGSLKVVLLKVVLLKVVLLKVVLLKVVPLKVGSLKVVPLEVVLLKVGSLKGGSLKGGSLMDDLAKDGSSRVNDRWRVGFSMVKAGSSLRRDLRRRDSHRHHDFRRRPGRAERVSLHTSKEMSKSNTASKN